MTISISDEQFSARLGEDCGKIKSLSHYTIKSSLIMKGRTKVILAFNQLNKSARQPLVEDYTSFLQDTTINGIYYNYYEVWEYDVASNLNVLGRIYLHIYMIENDNRWQLYSIHVDADESRASEKYSYKAAPHIHIETAPYPFNHYHHAFTPAEKYENIHQIDDAFETIVKGIVNEMIESEIDNDGWKIELNLRLEVLKEYRKFYDRYYLT